MKSSGRVEFVDFVPELNVRSDKGPINIAHWEGLSVRNLGFYGELGELVPGDCGEV